MCLSAPGKFAGSARGTQTPSPAEIPTQSSLLPRKAKTKDHNAAFYETNYFPRLTSAFVCAMLLLPLGSIIHHSHNADIICLHVQFACGFFFQ